MSTQHREERINQVVSQRQKGIIVLENIQDPHNAAAILRTCDSFGFQNVCLIFETASFFNPRRIGKSSSSSANKWLDYETFQTSEECFLSLKNRNYTLYGTLLSQQSKSIYETDFTISSSIALIVGNESNGLSEQAKKYADHHIMIPMMGMVESLNVSVATGICLYEITRQRKNKNNNDYGLSQQDKIRLQENFEIR